MHVADQQGEQPAGESVSTAAGSRLGPGPSSSFGSTVERGAQEDGYVVLNFQYLNDSTTRTSIIAGRVVMLVATAFLAYKVAAKFSFSPGYFLQHNQIIIINLCAAVPCCAALLVAGLTFAARIGHAIKAEKKWRPYQKRAVSFVAIQLVLQLVNTVFYVAPNIYVLIKECTWYFLSIELFNFVRWTCWAALFFMMVLQAHSMLPARYVMEHRVTKALGWMFGRRWPVPKAAKGLMVYDLPAWVHLPLLVLLWIPAQVAVILLLLWLVGVIGVRHMCNDFSEPGCAPPGASPDVPCNEWGWTCELDDRGQYLAIAAFAGTMLLLMLVTYFAIMFLVLRELGKLPYTTYRMENLAVRFQLQVQAVMAALFVLCVVLNWYVKLDGCNSWVMAWFGLPPMQLMMTCIVILNVVYTSPVDPSSRQLRLHQRLQQILWREGGTSKSLRSESGSLEKSTSSGLGSRASCGGDSQADWEEELEPIFCFETALKALYWSKFMYAYKQAKDSITSLDTALGLFGLEHHALLWEQKRCDTKCLVAWGEGTIVVGFRGTASAANVVADIKAWRSVHPPKRGSILLGTCPMVHSGFLDAYMVEGLNTRVMDQLMAIMTGNCCNSGDGSSSDGSTPCREWRLVCIGHSLGGALATLCSYDIAVRAARLQKKGYKVQVQLYTFGAPRPGNHAFARDFIRTVPDSWDVIHSNDAVAKEGKFLLLYKRAANRVLITSQGDILPRPSFLEASLHRGPTPSIMQHFLRFYARSFSAVIRGQFLSKATSATSRESLRQLLASEFVQELLVNNLNFRQRTLWRMRYQVLPSTASTQPGQLPSFYTDRERSSSGVVDIEAGGEGLGLAEECESDSEQKM